MVNLFDSTQYPLYCASTKEQCIVTLSKTHIYSFFKQIFLMLLGNKASSTSAIRSWHFLSYVEKIVMYLLGTKMTSITLVCSNAIFSSENNDWCMILLLFLCSNLNILWLSSSVNKKVNYQIAIAGRRYCDHKYIDPTMSSTHINSRHIYVVNAVMRVSSYVSVATICAFIFSPQTNIRLDLLR